MNGRCLLSALALSLGLLVVLLWALGGSFDVAQADPAVRYVSSVSGTDTGDCTDQSAPCRSIQYAVDQAADGDEIWVASLDNITSARYTGTGDTPIVSLNKSVTLRGGYIYAHGFSYAHWTPGVVPAVVDGEGARRALFISGDVTPTLELLAFVNGHADRGGNVYIENAHARLLGTLVLTGTAFSGGGLYLKDSDALLSGLLIQNNTATDGGGLYIEGGHPIILGGVIQQNSAERFGGGFYLKESAARIAAVAVRSNTAAYGAGFYLDGPFAFSEEEVPIIANNYIRHNRVTGSEGGAFYFHRAIAGLVNNIIADNQAAEGAALYLVGSSPQLYHNTIAQNTGSTGIYLTHKPGSIWPPAFPVPSHPSFTNTIIVSHTTGVYVASTGLGDILQNRASLDGTLWWGNEVDTAGPGEIVLGSINVYGDPRFTCVGDPPGCLAPYHILTDSAAVDAGVEVALTLPGTDIFVDIDGQLRPSGSGYDIGADEVLSDSYNLWLIPPLSVLPAVPGQTVTHTHWLLNTGLQTDTYDLAFHSSTGWATLLTASPITLSAQTSTTVQVRVAVPLEATAGMSDTSVITATSRAVPDRRARAVDVTSVVAGEKTDLLVGKWADAELIKPGGAVRFTIVITNAGPLTNTVPVTLTDTVIPAQAIQSWDLPAGCVGNVASGLVTCVLTLPAGAPPITTDLALVITTTEVYSGLLVNNAAVAPGDGLIDLDPTNNIAQAVVGVTAVRRFYLPLVMKNRGP